MKAVILAGGMGTRLLPLTATVPKPLVMLGDRPIIFHILDMLEKQGVDEVIITLGYLGERIEQAVRNYKTEMKIGFSFENQPLGTAGAVKNAVKGINEDFIVLSGDAYCEFDLKSIFEFHKNNNATATLVCTRVEDPREYGLILTGENGRITRFIEKPGWSQAVTNLANTGVYVLSEQALKFVPDFRQFDFSKNLFPFLLKKNLPVFAFEEKGYWCDIGEIESYLKCNGHILSKQKKSDSVPRGDFTVCDCVFIGENVTIGNNARIDKYSVICDNVTIGENTVVDGSVVYPDTVIGKDCRIEQSVICEKNQLRNGVRINPNCCVGADSVLGNNTVLFSSVSVAKKTEICDGVTLTRSVAKDIKTDRVSDVSNSFIPDVDIFFALELGCALGTAYNNSKIAVATDSNQKSKSVLYALISGLLQTGAQVWNFGDCFNAQMSFFTYFCSLPLGVFIKTAGENVSVRISSTGGLPLMREKERSISSVLKNKDYSFVSADLIRHPVEMQNVSAMYSSVLFRQSESSLSKMKVRVETENEKIQILLEECITRLEGEIADGIIIHISEDGSNLSVTENNIEYTEENILSVLLYYETKSGRDVSVSFFSPPLFTALASNHNGNLYRYFSSSADESDEKAREIARGQLWTRDALFMSIRLLSLMHEEGKTLYELSKDVPDFYLSKGETKIEFNPAKLAEIFFDMDNIGTDNEGITFLKNNSKAIILPDKDGKKVKILTESFDTEAAKDLCEEIIEKINSFEATDGT